MKFPTGPDLHAGLPGDDAVQTFNALLEKVTAPLVEVCHRSAGTLPASDGPHSESPAGSPHTGGAAAAVLPRHASRMYLINCLLAVWSPLSLHRVCSVYAATLKTMIDTEVRLCWASLPLCRCIVGTCLCTCLRIVAEALDV